MINRTKTYPICAETFEMMSDKSNKSYVLTAINVDYKRYKKVYTTVLLVVLIGLLGINPVSTFAPLSVSLFNYMP